MWLNSEGIRFYYWLTWRHNAIILLSNIHKYLTFSLSHIFHFAYPKIWLRYKVPYIIFCTFKNYHYSEQKIWISCLLFSAHDSHMEYSCWQCKYSSVSSDLKPPLPTRLHVTGLPKKQTDKFEVFLPWRVRKQTKQIRLFVFCRPYKTI